MHSLQLACALGLLAQGHSLNLALAVQGLQNDAATEARNAALLGRARPRPRPPAAAPPETWSKQAVFATTPQLPALSDTSGKPCAAGRLPPPTRMACGVLWYVHVTKAGGKARRGHPRRASSEVERASAGTSVEQFLANASAAAGYEVLQGNRQIENKRYNALRRFLDGRAPPDYRVVVLAHHGARRRGTFDHDSSRPIFSRIGDKTLGAPGVGQLQPWFRKLRVALVNTGAGTSWLDARRGRRLSTRRHSRRPAAAS